MSSVMTSAPSNPIQGDDEPRRGCEEDERHSYEYEVAHSCHRVLLLRFLLSEALWLHESIEQVNREAGGAEAGEPGHCGSGHN